jgi:hypothetical protein
LKSRCTTVTIDLLLVFRFLFLVWDLIPPKLLTSFIFFLHSQGSCTRLCGYPKCQIRLDPRCGCENPLLYLLGRYLGCMYYVEVCGKGRGRRLISVAPEMLSVGGCGCGAREERWRDN